jgi:hypothetical protein
MNMSIQEVGPNRGVAHDYLLSCLSICAYEHMLSRMLLEKYSSDIGRLLAITPEGVDLSSIHDFKMSWDSSANVNDSADFPEPRAVLISLAQAFLCSDSANLVVTENFGWNKRIIQNLAWAPPRLMHVCDNDILHILTSSMTSYDEVERSLVPRHYWQTTVLTTVSQIPEGADASELFIKDITDGTHGIIIPAFDGDGYIIWVPHSCNTVLTLAASLNLYRTQPHDA